ncbi:hypothetical protein PGB90_007024 [Kerria lacca]
MIWFKSIFFLTVAILMVMMVQCDPSPINRKTDSAEKSKLNTRHDHTSSTSECQYSKGTWSECNAATNTKTRMLTLKKGQDETKCEKTKTTEKKCKKICKYEKGTWSKCNAENEMTRTDVLRNPNESDASCEKSKIVTKTCKNKADRPAKGQKRKQHKQDQQNSKNKNKQK